MNAYPPSAQPLADLTPQRDFFIGIDSDGCAFDTMEIKHKECFIPNTIFHWHLQPVARYAREAAEFVNLYSKWRGVNRWPALLMVFDLLRERPEAAARGAAIPEGKQIREFVNSGEQLSDAGLRAYHAAHPQPELEQALAWTLAVNAEIARIVHGIPPYPFVRASLERLASQADMVVVSGTPVEALAREWREHGLDRYVRAIAGQEMGKKEQHLALAAGGKYAPERILMIGDAPGDLKAARANGALFYPIYPGQEQESWRRFHDEALQRFLDGSYQGNYENTLIAAFEELLPDTPPWNRKASWKGGAG